MLHALRLTASSAILLLACAAPLSAGSVQDLDVTPNPGTVGQAVSFTPQGSGSCNKVEIIFGDGMIRLLENVDFSAPPTVDYQYASTGTFEAKAKQASGDCSGKKTVDVVIEEAASPPDEPGSEVDHLCEIVDCDRLVEKKKLPLPKEMAMIPPELKMALHIPPEGVAGDQTLVPGGTIRLGGSHFGSEPGRVYINGIPGFTPLELEILEWNPDGSIVYDNTAVVRIPETPTGPFFPINVRLVLERKQGSSKNSTYAMKKEFIVPGEVRLLALTDQAVQVSHCSEEANYALCNFQTDKDFCYEAGQGLIDDADITKLYNELGVPSGHRTNYTIFGEHSNCHAHTDDDTGIDQYRISLKNGWVIYEIAGAWDGSSSNEEVRFPSPSELWAVKGQPEVEIPVWWNVSPADSIMYMMTVRIIGPPRTTHNY